MTTTPTTTSGGRRRWPLVLLALPASVAIWSGWVGLGQMAGFGLVRPLPGIADGFELNSAITLPIGVEAYSAYALGTWLSSRPIPANARRFAAWSSLASLALGLLGQVTYHLLTALGYTSAPVPVVVFVACLPVLVLGAGAALHHLLGDPQPHEQTQPAPATVTATTLVAAAEDPQPIHDSSTPGMTVAELGAAPARELGATTRTPPRPARASARSTRRAGGHGRRLLGDYLTDARTHLTPGVEPSPAWCRQVTGCSRGTSVKLAAALRVEQRSAPTPPDPTGPVDPAGADQEKERAA